MTARFGRNKRREARRQIAQLVVAVNTLGSQLGHEQSRRRRAEANLASAKEAALTNAMNKTALIQRAMDQIADRLAQDLGPKIKPIAERILASDQAGRKQPIWDARLTMDQSGVVEVLRGAIHLDYNVVLAR